MADSINDIKKWFNGLPSEYVFVAGTATVTSFVPKLMLLGLG